MLQFRLISNPPPPEGDKISRFYSILSLNNSLVNLSKIYTFVTLHLMPRLEHARHVSRLRESDKHELPLEYSV